MVVNYIVISGGVISGIGKGIVASSAGFLLKTMGYHVTAIKIDPYLNIDAGTISPFDHGEVFVLEDGGEVDMDLGNYERFLDITLSRDHNITTGKIYQDVIEKERRGDYLGKTVQVVPHITNSIQEWIERMSKNPVDEVTGKVPDFCIVELGGTVGDIESAPFVEAMRQFQFRVGHDHFCLIHVSLVPIVGSVGEQKSRPTQASVRELRGLGLYPDVIACRCGQPIEDAVKNKIAMACHVQPHQVFSVHDCPSVYHVPLLLKKQGLLEIFAKRFGMTPMMMTTTAAAGSLDGPHYGLLDKWTEICQRIDRLHDTVTIAIVGKYTDLKDSYLSVLKSLQHASLACYRKLIVKWVEANELEVETKLKDPVKYHEAWQQLCSSQGILVPGGFGDRGVEGKIAAAQWARTMNIPYLGICLGLQVAVIEFARNVLDLKRAHSTEFNATTDEPVVIYMPEISKTHMGGTMRLGRRATRFVKDGITQHLYGGQSIIYERHRHRYEVNVAYVPRMEEHGLQFVGHDEKGERMEVIELKNHRYFVGTQYHPEFLTRLWKPCPVFLGLILAATNSLDAYLEKSAHSVLPHPSSAQANGHMHH
jgi:CTP synthase